MTRKNIARNRIPRALPLLIAVLLLILPIVSCTGDTATVTTTTGEQTAQSTVPPTTQVSENLPDRDFDGRQFRVLVSSGGEYEVAPIDTSEEKYNDSLINDAVRTRNFNVSEKYNAEITHIVNDSIAGTVTKSVQAGSDDFDLVLPNMMDAGRLAVNGLLADWNELQYVDLSKPWYDQKLIEELSINGKMYYMMGDYQIRDDDHTWILLFNKTVVEDLKLTEPYELVRQGKWTMDTFMSMIKDASEDLNGDQKFDGEDRYGFLTTTAGGVTNFLFSCGGRITQKDDSGYPALVFNSDRIGSIMEKTVAIFKSSNSTYINTDWQKLEDMFISGKGLFYSEILIHARRLREMTSSFGILPCPKLDEAQEEYLTHVDPASPIMCIPVTSDADSAGFIMEALSAESYRILKPAFYEASITNKVVRDEQSVEMLDIITQGHVFDLGMVFDFGGMGGVFNSLVNKGSTDFASQYSSREEKALKAIEELWGKLGA